MNGDRCDQTVFVLVCVEAPSPNKLILFTAEGVWDPQQAKCPFGSHRVPGSLRFLLTRAVQLQRKCQTCQGVLLTAEAQTSAVCCDGGCPVLSCWQFGSVPVPAVNRGPSKAVQLRARSHPQGTGGLLFIVVKGVAPPLCCGERRFSSGPLLCTAQLFYGWGDGGRQVQGTFFTFIWKACIFL